MTDAWYQYDTSVCSADPRWIHGTSSTRRQDMFLVFMPARLQAGFFSSKQSPNRQDKLTIANALGIILPHFQRRIWRA